MAAIEKHRGVARWQALKTERASWMPHWTELSKYLQPRLGRFFTDDRNRGEKRHNAIYDSTGTRANRILAAGLMSGMTSPARPWFRLTTGDADLDQRHAVKEWLSGNQRIMLNVFAKSNAYRALHVMYEELGCFGTAANLIMPNFARVQHHFPFTAGEYAIATDYEGTVNAFYRELDIRVGALVGEFGRDNCSPTVRTLFDRGNVDAWITIIHGIEPRAERGSDYPGAKNMPYSSCYFEQGAPSGKYLREGGLKRFRLVAPRWRASGGDVYGNSPGMEALGDIKQLQHEQLRKGQGIDYQTKPPIGLPTMSDGKVVDLLPGGVTFFNSTEPSVGSRQMFQSNLDLNHLLADIQDVRGRINSAFYADLFLMLSQLPPESDRTATEVAERHEEKMIALGPVLEQLHYELLSPMVEMCFEDLLEAGAIPPPPPEMNGMPLNIEFVSVLAQAQRAIGTAATDRFVGNLGVVAGIKPDVLDKFDADKWADIYSDQLGVDPELVVPDEKVALIRQARAKAQQQAEQTAQAESMAKTANQLGNAPTQGGSSNALTDIMTGLQGYNAPSAESF
jgi:hypothetical protein